MSTSRPSAPSPRKDRWPRPVRLGALSLLLAWPLLGSAGPLAVGDALAPLSLSDQHDRAVQVDDRTRLVVFSAEKQVSEMVSRVLSAAPPDTLDRLGAVYVSDISGMPAIITQVFALPRWRQLPFSTALARDEAITADLPRQPGCATVLTLRNGEVASIQYVMDAAQLQRAMGVPVP